jgi:hypothetical protein
VRVRACVHVHARDSCTFPREHACRTCAHTCTFGCLPSWKKISLPFFFLLRFLHRFLPLWSLLSPSTPSSPPPRSRVRIETGMSWARPPVTSTTPRSCKRVFERVCVCMYWYNTPPDADRQTNRQIHTNVTGAALPISKLMPPCRSFNFCSPDNDRDDDGDDDALALLRCSS